MEISKVRIPSGTILNIKDATARTRLSELNNVENKNVATIKEEILTSANVKTALNTGTDDGTFLAKDGTWKVPAGGSSVQSDWNEADSTSDAYINNKPTLAAVATSGSYNDLTNKPTINNSSSIFFGTCSSAADAQTKEVTISDQDFTLKTGVIIAVKFTNTNTYSVTEENPITLNVNNTGAKQIYYSVSDANTGTSTIIYGLANRYAYYIYNENDDLWVWLSHGADTNSTYSAGTAALLTAGTNTTNRVWQAKILHDYISYPNVKYDVATQSKSGALTIDGSIPLHIITCTGNISSVALSTNPAAGHSCHVIFFATAARTVAIAHNATARVCPEAKNLSLSITANGYVEVDFLSDGTKVYVRGV